MTHPGCSGGRQVSVATNTMLIGHPRQVGIPLVFRVAGGAVVHHPRGDGRRMMIGSVMGMTHLAGVLKCCRIRIHGPLKEMKRSVVTFFALVFK